MERLIKRLVIGLLILAAVANAALFAGISLTQDPAPRAPDGQRIFTASRPAVVLVQANYGLTVAEGTRLAGMVPVEPIKRPRSGNG